MFKFEFNLEDIEDDSIPQINGVKEFKTESVEIQPTNYPPFTISSVQDLASIFFFLVDESPIILLNQSKLDNLPSVISYSPLNLPLSNGEKLTILRRDLFDIRFQLISEEASAEEVAEKLSFIDAPSDLVPGVYEGGLKTWESSVDLAAYIQDLKPDIKDLPCSLLEIGCGTAVPSLSFLHKLFQTQPSNDQSRKVIHLQDYNSIVLQLVTLPNVILAWYSSPASILYRAQEDPPALELDLSEPGELHLSPELLTAFTTSMRDRNIELDFISGSWHDMDAWMHEQDIRYDLILSSETIYRLDSLPSLITLLHSSFRVSRPIEAKGDPSRRPTCLVAAKVIYFGVGGGVVGFEKAIEEAGGQCITVFEQKAGVNRRIMQISWP